MICSSEKRESGAHISYMQSKAQAMETFDEKPAELEEIFRASFHLDHFFVFENLVTLTLGTSYYPKVTLEVF